MFSVNDVFYVSCKCVLCLCVCVCMYVYSCVLSVYV